MKLSPRQARATAELGFVFLYPLVANYRSMYAAAVEPTSPSFAGGFGHWVHHRAVSERQSSTESAHLTTLWSTAWIDIRHEPCVLILPAVATRSAHLFDLWGFGDDVSGLGWGGAPVLIATDGWRGALPPRLSRSVRVETGVVRCDDRVRPSGPVDLEAARNFQRRYRLEPLSMWQGRSPTTAPKCAAWEPVERDSLITMGFWSLASFALSLTHPHRDDRQLLDRVAEIGVVAGERWDPARFDSDVRDAIADGMDAAVTELMRAADSVEKPVPSSRAELEHDYFARALAALAAPDAVGIT